MRRHSAQRVLGLFAKAPVPGLVKTRLASAIGPDAAAEWYARSLRTIFRRTAAAYPHVERLLFFSPPENAAAFDGMPAAPVHRVPQVQGDLGARMAAAFRYCFDRAAFPVLIGTDAPSLPMEWLERAWRALESSDLVLGPAKDGGYYLIGLRAEQPALFADVAWGTDRVFATTRERAKALDLRVHGLPEWFDVDTLDDLTALPPDWEMAP